MKDIRFEATQTESGVVFTLLSKGPPPLREVAAFLLLVQDACDAGGVHDIPLDLHGLELSDDGRHDFSISILRPAAPDGRADDA